MDGQCQEVRPGRPEGSVRRPLYRAEHQVPEFYPVDPCEGDIWEIEYSAWRNGLDYPLTVDKELAFYAVIDGEKKGAEQLINEEYELQNDGDVVLDLKDAYRVSKKILKYYKQA